MYCERASSSDTKKSAVLFWVSFTMALRDETQQLIRFSIMELVVADFDSRRRLNIGACSDHISERKSFNLKCGHEESD